MKEIIILTAAIQGLLIASGLMLKKLPNRPSNIYLSLPILLFSLELLFSWGSMSGYNNSANRIPFWLLTSYLSVPPALWLFFRHNTETNFKFRQKHLLFFVPAIIEILISSVAYISGGKYLFFAGYSLWFIIIDRLPLVLTVIVLAIQSKKNAGMFKRFGRHAHPAFRLHVRKLAVFLGLFWTITLIWTGESFFYLNLHIIFLVYITLVLYGLAYLAYFNPAFFEIPKQFIQNRSEEFRNYNDQAELLRLTELFEKGKIFEQAKLSLSDLSEKLGLPPKYISYLINHYMACNFNDFLNRFRVDEMLRMIPLAPNKTLVGIAMDAGFNSKSTFNQAI